jgi:hypothetical protein
VFSVCQGKPQGACNQPCPCDVPAIAQQSLPLSGSTSLVCTVLHSVQSAREEACHRNFSCTLVQDKFVRDARQLYRSDFFPGLGWMLRNELWQELK